MTDKVSLTDAGLHTAYKVSVGITQTSAGATALGAFAGQYGMTVNELFLVAGFIVSVIGLIASIVIQWQWKKREFYLKKDQFEWDRRHRIEQVENERRKSVD